MGTVWLCTQRSTWDYSVSKRESLEDFELFFTTAHKNSPVKGKQNSLRYRRNTCTSEVSSGPYLPLNGPRSLRGSSWTPYWLPPFSFPQHPMWGWCCWDHAWPSEVKGHLPGQLPGMYWRGKQNQQFRQTGSGILKRRQKHKNVVPAECGSEESFPLQSSYSQTEEHWCSPFFHRAFHLEHGDQSYLSESAWE